LIILPIFIPPLTFILPFLFIILEERRMAVNYPPQVIDVMTRL
jgi:hypothetical protein